MAGFSPYDEEFLNDEQKEKIKAFTDEWNRAYAAGDKAGMEAAHRAAESVRAQSGYSGGDDGGGYYPFGQWSAWSSASSYEDDDKDKDKYYTPAEFKSYEAQTDAVNELYDRALEAKKAALRAAYEQNAAALEAEKAEIPIEYQKQKNATAAQSEVAGHNFREYAAASGLNSGAGGQAELARSNQLQGDLSALGAQEAADLAGAERRETELKRAYQNGIAEAVASGAYERAAALLEEYRKAEESKVETSRDQADEFYRWRQQWAKEIDEEAERLRREAALLN